MELKEALEKWGFSFKETEDNFEQVTHCWEKCKLETLFPTIHIMDCPKCDMRLTVKELAGSFLWSKTKQLWYIHTY